MMREGRRVCLLTGAGGVLGTAFCRRYAADFDIVAAYRHRKPRVLSYGERVVDPLRPQDCVADGANPIFPVRADLSDDREIERLVEIALARFDRIDLLVNAAAYSIWSPMLASGDLADSLAQMFRINVEIPLRLAAEVAKRFWQSRDLENKALNRNVVNISSIAGIYIYGNSGQSGYSASKAALNNLSMHMADEFAPFNVRVNVVAPDAFPAQLPTERVCDWIVRLDQSEFTGRIVVMDNEKDEII